MKYFITTPIFYANAEPHIAHAYTAVIADVLARFHRQQKDDVFFLAGMDEHGNKVFKKAEEAGKTPQDFCDEIAEKFEQTWKNLDISYDKFIRTTSEEHKKGAQFILNKLYAKKDIYQKDYTGLYCEGCEKFITKKELVNGECPDHKKKPIVVKEKNYFFKLASYLPEIKRKIETGELLIKPEKRKNEVLKMLEQKQEDISVSRESVKWGIDVPFDKKQTIYVWVEALTNYITALGYGEKGEKAELFQRYWPADLHLVGKDIIKFHTIHWPAMLLALGLPLPKQIYAHGFITVSGEKMSKTIGNVISPNDLVKRWGSDAVRYLLLSQFPLGEDGDVSLKKMQARYEADLANDLGNLLQRTLVMMKKYEVEPAVDNPADTFDFNENKFTEHLNKLEITEALAMIRQIITDGNKYIEEKKPWELAKDNLKECRRILEDLHFRLKLVGSLIQPFMPRVSQEMLKQLKTMDPEPMFKKG
ncbi:MAG: methionine--tRNA ligase [Patescibacteria group bacterium]|nr:methionine--tRNA ligase [Patescibacteria group bacterium]